MQTPNTPGLVPDPGELPLTPKRSAELHFLLGKDFENSGNYAQSFENYTASNDILRAGVDYRAGDRTDFVLRSKAILTRAFFSGSAGSHAREPTAIFVVGMPRAGLTLLEQILLSHPAIEGIRQSPLMSMIANDLDDGKKICGIRKRYPESLIALGEDDLNGLGEKYLGLTQRLRTLGRPYFVDRLPENFSHIGLIRLILPNARIIDMRRHPLDCGLSCFKSYVPFEQPFARRLHDIGRYYADYVALMAHYDDVLAGLVHRVIYERLIANPEEEVRRLLDYLALPFEEQCLRFHEEGRSRATPISEHARQPLYGDSVGYWRKYGPWLGPLKEALGNIVELYPNVPVFPSDREITLAANDR